MDNILKDPFQDKRLPKINRAVPINIASKLPKLEAKMLLTPRRNASESKKNSFKLRKQSNQKMKEAIKLMEMQEKTKKEEILKLRSPSNFLVTPREGQYSPIIITEAPEDKHMIVPKRLQTDISSLRKRSEKTLDINFLQPNPVSTETPSSREHSEGRESDSLELKQLFPSISTLSLDNAFPNKGHSCDTSLVDEFERADTNFKQSKFQGATIPRIRSRSTLTKEAKKTAIDLVSSNYATEFKPLLNLITEALGVLRRTNV